MIKESDILNEKDIKTLKKVRDRKSVGRERVC